MTIGNVVSFVLGGYISISRPKRGTPPLKATSTWPKSCIKSHKLHVT